MVLMPAVVIVGAALGLLARRRPRAQLALAVAAPILSALALGVQFIPGAYQQCTFNTVATDGTIPTTSGTCQLLPGVAGWSWPLTYLIVGAILLLSMAPLVSLRLGSSLPAGVSAVL